MLKNTKFITYCTMYLTNALRYFGVCPGAALAHSRCGCTRMLRKFQSVPFSVHPFLIKFQFYLQFGQVAFLFAG